MNFCHIAASCLLTYTSAVFYTLHYGLISRAQRGGKWGEIPRAPNHTGGAEILRGRRMTAGVPKSPNNVTSTFFNTVDLLPKDLRFEHGGGEIASCPGRHLSSLRPYQSGD